MIQRGHVEAASWDALDLDAFMSSGDRKTRSIWPPNSRDRAEHNNRFYIYNSWCTTSALHLV